MEDSTTVDPVYKRGFEHGYWLQRSNTHDLDKLIEKANSQPEYQSGMKAGQKEAMREQFRQRMSDLDKEQDKEKENEYD